jgi:hypothetical protein
VLQIGFALVSKVCWVRLAGKHLREGWGAVTQRPGQEEKDAKFGKNEPKRSQFCELSKPSLSNLDLLR